MWNVIERVSQEEFGYKPNVSAMRTAAVTGHKIFATIASFDEGLMSETSFQEFIRNIETFIIAQSQLGEESPRSESEEEVDDKVTENLGEDEWDF